MHHRSKPTAVFGQVRSNHKRSKAKLKGKSLGQNSGFGRMARILANRGNCALATVQWRIAVAAVAMRAARTSRPVAVRAATQDENIVRRPPVYARAASAPATSAVKSASSRTLAISAASTVTPQLRAIAS